MPTSVSLNTQDPVLAGRNIKKTIRRQLGKSSPFFAAMYGGSAERSIDGRQSLVTIADPHEVLQRDIQIAAGIAPAHIAPSASDTTSLGTTKATSVRTLYGGLTCAYAHAPMSLDEWIHGGPGARHQRQNIDYDNIAYDMTRALISGFLSTGAGANPDGALKWFSATDTKWGLNTTTAGNYYFRGHEKSDIVWADYDEDAIREDIRLCATGEILNTTLYHANGDPKLGICDSKTFSKLQAMISAKQVIQQPAGTTEVDRYMQIGGYFRRGIQVDQVTFFPDLMMDELKATNSSAGELFILNPDDWELIFLKGFAFDWITDPDKAYAKSAGKFEVRDLVNVVWGKVMVNIALYNWFCSFPRGQLYRTFAS